jgi:hypothetical protein
MVNRGVVADTAGNSLLAMVDRKRRFPVVVAIPRDGWKGGCAMRSLCALTLAAAVFALPYQANTQEKPAEPKCAVLVYCCAVVVLVVVGGVVFYCVKNTCDNLFNNPGFTNRFDSASSLTSGVSGMGTTTVQASSGPGAGWSDLYSFDVIQSGAYVPNGPSLFTVTMFKAGVPVATNAANCYSNGQCLTFDFRATTSETNPPSAAMLRLVN